MSKAIGGHEKPYRGETDTWLTPPCIVEDLGPFDLDPCCPPVMPWATAKVMYSLPVDDGMARPWFGRVWLNPPYGPETGKWLSKLADHGDGIALVFARTETEMFFRFGWDRATAMLFLKSRLHFHRPDGVRAKANAGAPSVLLAYGSYNAARLEDSSLPGQFIHLRTTP